MRKNNYFLFVFIFLLIFSCTPNKPVQETHHSNAPIIEETKSYVKPKDSTVIPKTIIAGAVKIIPAGKPEIVPVNTNIHPVGIPKMVFAGTPRVITPGQNPLSFSAMVLAKGKNAACIQPLPVPALPLRMKDAANFNMRYLDVDQGMNSSYVLCIMQDKTGNLWFGTSGGGLTRYDGARFTHFTEKEGLNNNDVLSILQDKTGNLWFGTQGGGVTKYNGKHFTHFTEKQGLANNIVRSILEDKSGNLWFGTQEGGVTKYDGIHFKNYSEKEGLSNNYVRTIYQDKNGNLWFGTYGGGVTKYDGTSFTQFTKNEGLSSNVIGSIMEDKNGNIWFGTQGGGVIKYDGKHFMNYTEKEGLTNNYISSILEDKTGNIWFGSNGGGVMKYDRTNFIHYTEKEGLSSNMVYSIFQDNAGNLWFGTYGGGVTKFGITDFTHFSEKEGLKNNYVLSILEDKTGNLWFGTNGGGVTKYDGKHFINYTEKQGLSNNYVRAMLQDKDGNFWFGTYGGGVTKFDGSYFTYYTEKQGLSNNYIWSILQDKKGNLWFGTNGGGVSKFDGTLFTHYTEKQGLGNNIVWSILEDKTGNLWFGSTSGGISKFDGKSFTKFAIGNAVSDNTVYCQLEDKEGNFWLGTNHGGVCKYDGETLTHYTTLQGLSNNIVWSILQDKSGNLWATTERGLSYFINFFSGNENVSIMTFTKEDGLKGEDFYVNSALIDSKGRAWWGSGKCLTMLKLNGIRLPQEVPIMQLNNIELEQSFIDYHHLKDTLNKRIIFEVGDEKNKKSLSDISFSGVSEFYNYPLHLKLPYYLNHLTFHYVGIDWAASHKIQYQYMLEGLDKDWQSLTRETKADYRNIQNGNYTFKVRAIGMAGKWSNELKYTFTIRPPWWKTWWAYASYIILLVAGYWYLVRQRMHKLQTQKELLEIKVEDRTKELKQTLDNLTNTQLQLIHSEKMASLGQLTAGIAHEINNPINFVSANITPLKRDIDEIVSLLEKYAALDANNDQNKFSEIVTLRNEMDLNYTITEIKSLIKGIEEGSRRTTEIVKGLRNFSRLDEEDMKRANINDGILSTLVLLQNKMREENIELHKSLAELPEIECYPSQLNQVFMNLLTNSIDAFRENLSPGSGGRKIFIVTAKESNQIKISFRDTGPGMSDEVKKKIFDPFFTTKDIGKGTGLGLSISYGIIEKHHGSIEVRSEFGKGCEFVILLPA